MPSLPVRRSFKSRLTPLNNAHKVADFLDPLTLVLLVGKKNVLSE